MNKLLQKQLARAECSHDVVPQDLVKWQKLLERIDNAYNEHDQERYLNERSIEVSSHEMMDLNKKLEHAQKIAKLGYWIYKIDTKHIFLSNDVYQLLDLKNVSITDIQQLLQMVYAPHRDEVIKKIEQAISEKSEFASEIRIQLNEGEYRWYSVIGQIDADTNKITGIIMDIDQRKKAEEELHELHKELLTTARMAGMAEVASSVLHNVGNILNSVNVSIGLVQENIQTSLLKKLFAAVDLMKDHQSDVKYLIEDPKGKLIPAFLVALSDKLKEENKFFVTEITNLHNSVQHIREIVSMQQSHSRSTGVIEKVFLPEITDAALQMCGNLQANPKIQVDKIYDEIPFVIVDKSKLLQILVNLLQNAKDSVMADEKNLQKSIKIFIRKSNVEGQINIIVADNGLGIAPEDFVKIFSFGFTKKSTGHGIGLHTSALGAKELNGTLQVASEGLGHGATFTLTLPLIAAKERGNGHESIK